MKCFRCKREIASPAVEIKTWQGPMPLGPTCAEIMGFAGPKFTGAALSLRRRKAKPTRRAAEGQIPLW